MNISKRNDILYGQNWVEQLRSIRVQQRLTIISECPRDTPYALMREINIPTHMIIWQRRTDMYMIDDLLGYGYDLIK